MTSNQYNAPAPAKTKAITATATPALSPADEWAAVDTIVGIAVVLELDDEECVGEGGFAVLEPDGSVGEGVFDVLELAGGD